MKYTLNTSTKNEALKSVKVQACSENQYKTSQIHLILPYNRPRKTASHHCGKIFVPVIKATLDKVVRFLHYILFVL